MQIQGDNYVSATMVFAELELAGRIVKCPRCHVPLSPHLGMLIKDRFHCGSCNAILSYRKTYEEKTVMCPSCNMWHELPSRLIFLFCGGCGVEIIYKRGDRTVKCSVCKKINNPPPEANVQAHPDEWIYIPQSFPAGPPQQVNLKETPAHRAHALVYIPQSFPARLPRQVNLRATAEEESTASSCITPQPPSPLGIRIDEPVQERTRQLVISQSRETVDRITRERELEIYRKEKAEGKKILRF